MKITLKKILSRKELKSIIDGFRDDAGISFSIHDKEDKLISGKVADGMTDVFPIVVSGETIGNVRGGTGAKQIASIIVYSGQQEFQKKELAREILEKYKELNLIYRIGEKISSCLDPIEVSKLIIEEMKALFSHVQGDALNGSLMLLNEQNGMFEVINGFGHKSETKEKIRHGEGIAGNVVLNRKGEIVNNVSTDPRFKKGSREIYSMMCAPLNTKDRVIGVLNLSSFREVIFSAEDLRVLTMLASYAASAIDNAMLYKDLEYKVLERTRDLNEAYSIIKMDLQLAKRIQESLLPRDIRESKDFKIYYKFIPMSEVGGDIYDISEIMPGRLRVFIADATGHGVKAALVTMLIKGEYETLKKSSMSTGDLLHELNNRYIDFFSSLAEYFTCALVDIDFNAKKIFYSSAGHPMQYFVNEGVVHGLGGTGKIIGVKEDAEYTTVEKDFLPGGKIIVFTDGFFEQFNYAGEVFGEERVRETIQLNAGRPAKKIIDTILNGLSNFIGISPKNDDITVIGIDLKE